MNGLFPCGVSEHVICVLVFAVICMYVSLSITLYFGNGSSIFLRFLFYWLQLIKRGAQIDVCDYLGKSPLLRACEASRLDLVEALLDLGVSPNPHDLRCAHFPLQTAIRRNDAEIVKVKIVLCSAVWSLLSHCTKCKN